MAVTHERPGGILIDEVDLRALPAETEDALYDYELILHQEARPDIPPPTRHQVRVIFATIPDFMVISSFLGRDPDGAVVAYGGISFQRREENRHAAHVEITVRADRRRQGIGSALLERVVGVAAEESRSLLISWTGERVPSGEAFARAVGAQAAQVNRTSRLLLADVDRDLIRGWVEEGPRRAPDYRLVAVDGPYPDDLLGPILEVVSVMNTAPRDDLDIEDERFTAEQARAWEERMEATGSERWSLFARHEPTGELIGITEVFWNPERPTIVAQGDTAVRPDHRGHALGKWLKAAMLDRILAERSEATEVRTQNAESNAAMLGINVQLGFRPHEATTTWQVPLETVNAFLAGR